MKKITALGHSSTYFSDLWSKTVDLRLNVISPNPPFKLLYIITNRTHRNASLRCNYKIM